ncbi:hypothetical protein SCP_0408850 [Sparassis crispa]|uniref:Uncharacterized protein n=1 Tax=Sparassis crispa TaxID=139825 RepID=A0A401GK04_9APHY|nr:hypothetical protein SCP_0408850 [Sparassis crispa]GBE82501.1 hypothetical protein SCP_0408850 [Sparassis crispa]
MSEHIQFPCNYKQKERERGAGGEADAAQAALHACAGELLALWRDPVLSEILRRKWIRVDDGPGFFLDDLERITTPQYLPSNDLEYQFEMEAGSESGTQWRIIDVGSSRSQSSPSAETWVPFFDDVDAIIFLAPISCFDQVLAEDRSVNRLVRVAPPPSLARGNPAG